jgi:hypothetical protein
MPTNAVASITDVRYEHVAPLAITPDIRLVLEVWDCNGGPRDGPAQCPLVVEHDNVFRCHTQLFLDYLQLLSVKCNVEAGYGIDVTIRSSTGEWFMQVAHDIFLNNTRVARFRYPTVPPFPTYPWEMGSFLLSANGQIY